MAYMIEDYEVHGGTYSRVRRPDPTIAKLIHNQLGAARFVLNVGAGSGSYEPPGRFVLAVEPSAVMRRQRGTEAPPALIGYADSLPFDDGAFDAAMAILTVHHWSDLTTGLREMRRVTKGPVVVMSFDPEAPTDFWMFDYVPEMRAVERARYPSTQQIADGLGGTCAVIPVPVLRDCQDGFQEALYARPEEFLRDEVRRSQSAWSFLPKGVEARFVKQLAEDLNSGAWDTRYGHLRTQAEVRCQLRLYVSRLA